MDGGTTDHSRYGAGWPPRAYDRMVREMQDATRCARYVGGASVKASRFYRPSVPNSPTNAGTSSVCVMSDPLTGMHRAHPHPTRRIAPFS